MFIKREESKNGCGESTGTDRLGAVVERETERATEKKRAAGALEVV